MKVDLLAIGVHPDDVELSCSGTLLRHMAFGKSAGRLDLTRGELGTRRSASLRKKEAAAAAKILGVSFRDNLGMKDGAFSNDSRHQIQLIKKIREYRPEIVLCNAVADRHPDHGRSSALVSEACFYSGLRKITSTLNGKSQQAWRPKAVYHYIQDRTILPDFVVDVSKFADKKMKSILAYSSQFHNPFSKEPSTPISSEHFLSFVMARMRVFGREIGVEYAEGFTVERKPGISNLFDLY